MISSRALSHVLFDEGKVLLSDLRREIENRLEQVDVLGSQLFDVRINETTPAGDASETFWQWSTREVDEADIVIVLYNGDAGTVLDGEEGDIGICHAELQVAVDHAMAKVRLIELPLITPSGKSKQRNERFRSYVGGLKLKTARVSTKAAALTEVDEAVKEGLHALLKAGVAASATVRYSDRSSLQWDRLDFQHRREVMTDTLREALSARSGATETAGAVVIDVAGESVVFRCDAVPAAMGIAAAREMVGQPFLADHRLAVDLRDTRVSAGPVHLIACHKTISESQASRMLGFPDAMVISTEFGVYVADDVSKTQIVFIRNCRNDTATRHGVSQLFSWLMQSGERQLLAQRARSRLRIANVIADELVGH